MNTNITIWQRLGNYLTTGHESNVYIAGHLTPSKADCPALIECCKSDPAQAFYMVSRSMHHNQIYKTNHYALFALAYGISMQKSFTYSHREIRQEAARVIAHYIVSSAELFIFMEYVTEMRGWGRLLRKAIAKWYNSKDPYQLASRLDDEGTLHWTHKKLIGKCHPIPRTWLHAIIYQSFVSSKRVIALPTLRVISKYEIKLKRVRTWERLKTVDPKYATGTLRRVRMTKIGIANLPKHLSNDNALVCKIVGKASLFVLIPRLVYYATIGIITPENKTLTANIIRKLETRGKRANSARIDPFYLLDIRYKYMQGTEWQPVNALTNAMFTGARLALCNINPLGRKTLVVFDATCWRNIELPYCGMTAFDCFSLLKEHYSKDTLIEILLVNLCNIPDIILENMEKQRKYDAFIFFTDSVEGQDISAALFWYHYKISSSTKCVAIATMGKKPFVCDAAEPSLLEVVGFDWQVPRLVRYFVRTNVPLNHSRWTNYWKTKRSAN